VGPRCFGDVVGWPTGRQGAAGDQALFFRNTDREFKIILLVGHHVWEKTWIMYEALYGDGGARSHLAHDHDE
jgi:hypothetical protein